MADSKYEKAMAAWKETTAYWSPEQFRDDEMIQYALDNVVDAVTEDQGKPDCNHYTP
jgi:hypothetical protein